jgi:hypothetical protein
MWLSNVAAPRQPARFQTNLLAVPRQLFACAHSAYKRNANHKRNANRPKIPTIRLQHVITPLNMALSYSDKEIDIQEAIGAWRNHPERSIADIAREFGVSLWALRRRLHRVPSRVESGRHNKKLIPDREQTIIQHIELLEDFRIALRPKFL